MSRGTESNTYCMERVPGGYNLNGRLCHNVIPIHETRCSDCKVRLEREKDDGKDILVTQ